MIRLFQQTQTDPFVTTAFRAQLTIDNHLRSLMIGGGVLAGAVAFLMPGLGVVSSLVAPAALLGLWFWITMSTARVGRTLPMIGVLLTAEPAQAQALIDQSLNHRPVMRWARLLTYHRLASLRHQQRRFNESSAICLCLLNEPLKGPAAQARPHLLLMLAEAQLETGNLPGAYHALAHLHQTRLGLVESLQRLALQTRYELAIGAYASALHRSRAKVELAELMPPVHCATMHAMLATAAHQAGQLRLANWLWERTRLLAEPGLLAQLERGGFGIGVVEVDRFADAQPA